MSDIPTTSGLLHPPSSFSSSVPQIAAADAIASINFHRHADTPGATSTQSETDAEVARDGPFMGVSKTDNDDAFRELVDVIVRVHLLYNSIVPCLLL